MLSNFSSRMGNKKGRSQLLFLSVIVCLIITLTSGTLLFYRNGSARAAATNALVPFHGTVPTLLKQSKLLGATDANQSITLSIGLNLRYENQLKGYIQDIYRPKSINYHRYLTPQQFDGVFAPSPATYNAVLHYLQQSGFTITNTYTNRLLIGFRGTIGLAEQAFHVTINNYTAPNGQAYYANTSDPLLPASIASNVLSLDGLNNTLHFQHAAMPARTLPSSGSNSPTVSCLGHGGGYLTPDQIASGYNLQGIYNQGLHGGGQIVGLFELDSFQMSDISAYESCYGKSKTNIATIPTGQDPIPADKGMIQVESDAELILGTAPTLGQLRIYEAGTSVTDYNGEWAQILVDSPPVVSTSWYTCESDILQSDPNELSQENAYFTTAAAQGETILAASGNSGSSGCYFDNNANPTLSADDPAAQPYVTAVGGTTLTVNSNGSYKGENTWNDPVKQGQTTGASGGGLSQEWKLPSWQSAPGVQNQYSNGMREVPDVALNADVLSGYPIYCTAGAAGCSGSHPWITVGGTGPAADIWAAMIALVNEGSENFGSFPAGFVNPLLYQDASSSSYNNDFHDITTGNNDYANLQPNNLYPATNTYDLATGLGSFNASNLLTDLDSLILSNSGFRTAPANSEWYFAEGSVGGGFQEYLTLSDPDPVNLSKVAVTYLIQGHPSKTVNHIVNASSRLTINVNSDLGVNPSGSHESVAAIVYVTTGPPIIAERPMYFNYNGIQSGTDVIGAAYPGTSYYFSEADSTHNSTANYSTFITMLNPSTSLTDSVKITFYTGNCTTNCPSETKNVGPLQRQTASPTDLNLHQKMAISVISNYPVVVERPMYFTDNIPNAGGKTTGAASEVGATAPGTDWLFAEGSTQLHFQTYYELANFGANAANATVKLEFSDGTTASYPVTVPAYGFTTFDVNAHPGDTTGVSAEITSDNPIVADRLMYFHYGSALYSGSTDVVGATAASGVYSFAEGYTAGNFHEYLTIQNPTGTNETVAVTFFVNGLIFQEQITATAHSRTTLNINNIINPISSGAVSIMVQAVYPTNPSPVVVAERPLYFGYNSDQGGTDVIGYTGS
ncbi:MAG: S53 family peptidase [Ktedonobacteraceae bacterium]